MADGGIMEAALLGAAMGGGTSALTGGDPLKGALTGALFGGVGSQFGSLLGSAGGGTGTALTEAASNVPYNDELLGFVSPKTGMPMTEGEALPDLLKAQGVQAGTQSQVLNQATNPMTGKFGINAENLFGESGGIKPWAQSLNATQIGALGGSALGAMQSVPTYQPYVPEKKEYTGPIWDWSTYRPSLPPTPRMAAGGIANLGPNINVPNSSDWVAQQQAPVQQMASGGISNLGSYSDGGRLLKGPGDGVSDNIPASIGGKQPARLADGEFVVPARIVSEIGNGSTDAGAKRLYDMMNRVQSARSKSMGKGKFAVNSRADKFLPA